MVNNVNNLVSKSDFNISNVNLLSAITDIRNIIGQDGINIILISVSINKLFLMFFSTVSFRN
jgi:hypothetical protein